MPQTSPFSPKLATLQTGNNVGFQNILNRPSNRCLWWGYEWFWDYLNLKKKFLLVGGVTLNCPQLYNCKYLKIVKYPNPTSQGKLIYDIKRNWNKKNISYEAWTPCMKSFLQDKSRVGDFLALDGSHERYRRHIGGQKIFGNKEKTFHFHHLFDFIMKL